MEVACPSELLLRRARFIIQASYPKRAYRDMCLHFSYRLWPSPNFAFKAFLHFVILGEEQSERDANSLLLSTEDFCDSTWSFTQMAPMRICGIMVRHKDTLTFHYLQLMLSFINYSINHSYLKLSGAR
jgi:hypothetical protein